MECSKPQLDFEKEWLPQNLNLKNGGLVCVASSKDDTKFVYVFEVIGFGRFIIVENLSIGAKQFKILSILGYWPVFHCEGIKVLKNIFT